MTSDSDVSRERSRREDVVDASVQTIDKFAFGKNWSQFLEKLDPQRLATAEESLKRLLARSVDSDSDSFSLDGKRFLDAGSGSGLFSLSAFRMGANVTSFDADPDSVGCSLALRDRRGDAASWNVISGSLLDQTFMESLGKHDVVYCWGVAHHTGDMWTAINHLIDRVDHGGTLVLAIYNDQSYVSQIWRIIKRTYMRLPTVLRPVFACFVGIVLIGRRFVMTLLASVFRVFTLKNPLIPFLNWANETQGRGMHVWHDLVDWVGGWPFEVAKPEDIFRELRDRDFELRELITCAGHGCNEFVFRRRG